MPRALPMAVPAALAALALICSCSNDEGPTGPVGDCGGNHLLLFASDRGRTAGDTDIWLYDLDQSGFRLLRNANSTSPERNPAITPEARIVAFESTRAGSADIYLYDRCNEVLVNPPAGVNTTAAETEPTFSGDGNFLGFVRDTLGARRIRLVNGVTQLFDPLPGLAGGSGSDWAPAINQTAGRIAFVSDRNGDPDVLVWDRGTGILALPDLAASGAQDLEPSLSADGRYLAFASDRAVGSQGGFDVYLYDLGATPPAFVAVPELNGPANDRNPALSAPGNYIVFESDRTGGQGDWDLWNYNRTAAAPPSQQTGQSSGRPDLQPALRWP